MKTIIYVSLSLVIITVLTSAFLLYKGIEGWGWFLFAAILFATGISYTENDKDKKEKSEP